MEVRLSLYCLLNDYYKARGYVLQAKTHLRNLLILEFRNFSLNHPSPTPALWAQGPHPFLPGPSPGSLKCPCSNCWAPSQPNVHIIATGIFFRYRSEHITLNFSALPAGQSPHPLSHDHAHWKDQLPLSLHHLAWPLKALVQVYPLLPFSSSSSLFCRYEFPAIQDTRMLPQRKSKLPHSHVSFPFSSFFSLPSKCVCIFPESTSLPCDFVKTHLPVYAPAPAPPGRVSSLPSVPSQHLVCKHL